MTAQGSPVRPFRARPIFCFLSAFIAGITIGPFVGVPAGLLLAAAALLIVVGVALPQRTRAATLALLSAIFAVLGMARERQAVTQAVDDASRLAGGPSVWVTGVIASEVSARPSGSVGFTLAARSVDDFERTRTASGLVNITLVDGGDGPLPAPGDRVAVRGRVVLPEGVRNPGGFDERAFLARRGIRSILTVRRPTDFRPESAGTDSNPVRRTAESLRRGTLSALQAHLSPDDAALESGILVADRGTIPANVRDALARTGALYILSASGLHLSVLALVAGALFAWIGLPKRWSNLVLIALLWLIVLAAGAGTSSVRGGVMLTVVLLGPLLRRAADPLNSLAVAGLLLLTLQPLALFDPGFLLSFATVGVILLWMPPLQALWLSGASGRPVLSRATRFLCRALLGGAVAHFGSAPLVAYYYNQYSFVAPVATVCIAPAAVLLLMGGMGVIGLSALLPTSVSSALLWAALAGGLHLLRGLILMFSSVPFAAVSVESPPPALLFLYYATLAAAAIALRRRALRRNLFMPHARSKAAGGP